MSRVAAGSSVSRAVALRAAMLLGVGATLWISGCTVVEPFAPQLPEETVLLLRAPTLSDPTTLVGSGVAAASGLEVVYVSLAPGSLPAGSEVGVRNLARGVEELIPIAAGGFDPVPIAAVAGDVLLFRVFDGWPREGESLRPVVTTWSELVPARRPPVIVRTYPPKGRRDLPVALSVLVVFSEPIDSTSATAGGIGLFRDGSRVPGSVQVGAGGLRVTFEPAAPLLPSAEYVLRIASEVRDLDGDPFAGPEDIAFSTGDPASQAILAPTDLCSGEPPGSIPTFEDANLEEAVRTELGWPAEADLTCELVAGLSSLSHIGALYHQIPPPPAAISSIVGIQNLTGLTRLVLANHALTDLSPLSGLTSLDTLNLSVGTDFARSGVDYWAPGTTPPTISDLGPLRGLTGLMYLNLNNTTGIRDLSPLGGLTGLSELHLRFNSIADLRPLGGLTGLTVLNLAGNTIVDIAPLSTLTNLTWLAINTNQIVDISPLAGLTKIGGWLFLSRNRITDLSPISGLRQVTHLMAWMNSITDVSGLASLTNLKTVNLDSNPGLADMRPFLDNPGFGAGDDITFTDTNVSCDDVALLRAKGIVVRHACGLAPVPTVAVTTSSLPGASLGVPYSQLLMATGGAGVYTWMIGTGCPVELCGVQATLPAGLTLSPSGVISGVPTAAGTAWFTVTALSRIVRPTNTFTARGSRVLAITVSGP